MEAKREQLVRERMVELEFKISRLGILGKAYYELAQIKLRRHRNEIRISRTQNMLLHAALAVLREKARIARRNAGDLGILRKTVVAQRITFNTQKEFFFKKQDQLAKQLSDTHSYQLEMEWTIDPNTPELVRIRILERKLQMSLFKLNDMKQLLNHYEGIYKPMKEEHNLYAAKLDSFRIIVDMKNMECEKLIQTHHDAIRARDAAKRELEDLMVSVGAHHRRLQNQIPAELQARMLKAIAEIKDAMEVSSMREMYHLYLLQEKQTAYMDQIFIEMKRTRDQLEGNQRRRSSLPKPKLHNMVAQTRLMVRRQSERNPSLRRDSIPLFQILDGTKRLLDKLHDGNLLLIEGDENSFEREVLMSCEDKLTLLLKALNRKLKHVEKMKKEREEYQAMSDAEKRAFDEHRRRWTGRQERVHDAELELRDAQSHARQLADLI